MEVILTGSEITVKYKEPVVNKDGSPLTDLDHTSVFSQIGSDIQNVGDIPASSTTGGGDVEYQFIAPVGADQEADVTVWARAYDGVGNESDPSASQVVRVDHLPPGAPI